MHIYLMRYYNEYYEPVYKIGVTNRSPQQRLKELHTALPSLQYVSSYETPWARKIEKSLHHLYKAHNVGGELFLLSPEFEFEFLNICQKKEADFQYLKENSTLQDYH